MKCGPLNCALQKKKAEDLHTNRPYTFGILIYTYPSFTANSTCKHVLKIVDRFSDHSAPGILHRYTFPPRAIANFKDGISVYRVGLGNQWLRVRDKHGPCHRRSSGNGI